MLICKSAKVFEDTPEILFELVHLAFVESSVIEVDHVARDVFIGSPHFLVSFRQLDQCLAPILVRECPNDMPGLFKLVQHAGQSGFSKRCALRQLLYQNVVLLPQGK